MCHRCKSSSQPVTTQPSNRNDLKASLQALLKLPNNLNYTQPNTKQYKASNKLKKLWELPKTYHCPVIGTCLDVDELSKLARQAQLDIVGLTDYELHSYFVSCADRTEPLTKLTHKYLMRKYASTIKRTNQAGTPAELERLWEQAWQRGDIAATFWALLIQPSLDIQLQQRIYGEVHMLSHQVGAMQRVDRRKLHEMEAARETLRLELNAAREQLNQRDRHVQQLEKQVASLQTQCVAKQEQACPSHVNDLHEQLKQVNRQQDKLLAQLNAHEQRYTSLQSELAEVRTELDVEREQKQQLEQELQELVLAQAVSEDAEAEDEALDLPDLNGKCILYVGGRDKLKPHLRSLVEQSGGRFLHHDGGLHNKVQHLEQLLCQADTVFCPLNCISHNACNKVKQFCRKHEKQMIFLPRESLAAFSKQLQSPAQRNLRATSFAQ